MPAKLKVKPKSTQKTAVKTTEPLEKLSEAEVFTVIDIETTGLSPKTGGQIVEVAAVKVIRGRIVGEYATLIDPLTPLPKKTTQITGIEPSDVKGQPTLDQVIPELVEFMGSSVLVAHNARFETLFLNDAFSQFGYAPKNKWLCTMKLFRQMFPERKKMGLSSKLDDLTQHYGINFTEAEHHRALPDTIATAKAFLEMRKELLPPEVIEQELLLDTDVAHDVIEDEKIEEFHFTSANYWEKCYNKKRDTWARRFYVGFTSSSRVVGSVYYDLYTKQWVVQSCEDKLTKETRVVDVKEMERQLLVKLRADSMHAHLKRLGVFKSIKTFMLKRSTDKITFLETIYPEQNIKHIGYKKNDVPYDIFRIKDSQNEERYVFVTNEKRGSKYKWFTSEDAVR